jgi:sugar phosphate isomerase/epimerase
MPDFAHRLGIDFISVLAMPPVEHIRLAAKLGCNRISLAPAPFTANPHGYAAWSLRDDQALRSEVKTMLAGEGVALSIGEGFLIWPSAGMELSLADLDLFAEVGCERVNVVAVEPDRSVAVDQLGSFARLANERGLKATVEFMPGTVLGDFNTALAARSEVGDGNLSLLVDTMHFGCSGSSLADLAACDTAAIKYLQVCDAWLDAADDQAAYGEIAKHNRLPPGEGELPVQAILAAAPRDVPVGIELPRLSLAGQGIAPEERLLGAVATTRRMLETL